MRAYFHFKNGIYLSFKTYENSTIFSLIGVFVCVLELT